MNDFDDKLPPPDRWNDLLIEYADMEVDIFHCPGSRSEGKMSDYAINAYLYENKFWSADCVGLFESKPGWNQISDIEIFNSSNHKNKGGCYNTGVFLEGQFIESEKSQKFEMEIGRMSVLLL